MKIPYMLTDDAFSTIIDGKMITVNSKDDRFPEVVKALREDRHTDIVEMFNGKGRMISDTNGGLYLKNGIVYCDSYAVPSILSDAIVKMKRDRQDVAPLCNFLENLMKNPSEAAREELYGFLQACTLPITDDGHFLAYKMVRSDFTDIYTGRMDNSVGARPSMNREDVDDRRDHTCSRGLHFCSDGYLGEYGTRNSAQVVVLKINPRDVVSIPTDYNNSKGRACEYEVVDAISWDEKITDDYTSEYSEDVEPVNLRWQVIDRNTGEVKARLSSRQKAREFVWESGEPSYFVFDNESGEVPAVAVPADDHSDGASPEVPNPVVKVVEPPVATPTNITGAVLTEDNVRKIHQRLITGKYETIVGLAAEFGVSERSIRRIRDGESWTHITGKTPR